MKKQETASHSNYARAINKKQIMPLATNPRRKSSAAGAPVASHVSGNGHEEMIRQRAYSLYEARNCESGHDLEDWLQAEAQISQP